MPKEDEKNVTLLKKAKGYSWGPQIPLGQATDKELVESEVNKLKEELEKPERRVTPSVQSQAPMRSPEDHVRSDLMWVLRQRNVKDPEKAFVNLYGSMNKDMRDKLALAYEDVTLAMGKGDAPKAGQLQSGYFQKINSLVDGVAPVKPGAKTLEQRAYDTVMKDVKDALKGIKDAKSLLVAYDQDGTISSLVNLQLKAAHANPGAANAYRHELVKIQNQKKAGYKE